VAGAPRPLFTEGAVRVLHEAAGGIPRVLNHLATQSLLEAMGRGADVVDEAIATAAAASQHLLEEAG
jgi:general secretion pathway protein A